MNQSETRGAWIACGVLACAVAVLGWHLSARVVELRNAGVGAKGFGSVALSIGTATLGVAVAVGAFRQGNRAIRWFVVAACALFAAGVVGTAIWMTTLDYPNATSPEERAAMKQDDRDQLPVRVLTGVAPLIVASALLLPPVGSYLAYRRRVTTPA